MDIARCIASITLRGRGGQLEWAMGCPKEDGAMWGITPTSQNDKSS